ncbi:MAG: hypothetical protein HY001_02840 [Candidatus Portnoybacteria bacterium]|nr:hypothetical protein [Candidatus Portnoybacteria bacterium]
MKSFWTKVAIVFVSLSAVGTQAGQVEFYASNPALNCSKVVVRSGSQLKESRFPCKFQDRALVLHDLSLTGDTTITIKFWGRQVEFFLQAEWLELWKKHSLLKDPSFHLIVSQVFQNPVHVPTLFLSWPDISIFPRWMEVSPLSWQDLDQRRKWLQSVTGKGYVVHKYYVDLFQGE